MTLKNAAIWILAIAALGGGGFMAKLMHNMTHQVELLAILLKYNKLNLQAIGAQSMFGERQIV